ncbi:MAG: class I SAM-dependent methyltransferase [Candidatus Methylacidiphilales bacterium]|nr:class I SAM-dependent methyltransferase [Candidatus Methylacidiphilales bacterium]
MTEPPPDFDEALYLKLNPDVSEAVHSGQFQSGWQHYVCFGSAENRPGVQAPGPSGVDPFWDQLLGDVLPPPRLRKRVHGNADIISFEQVGKIVAFDIATAVPTLGHGGKPQCVLDFGCGCGRVLRQLHKLTSTHHFYGCDIDPEAIDWCRAHLGHLAQFNTNPIHPPLPYEDNFFDTIFCISIFTHLPEEMEHLWLSELRRVTKPGGHVLLTTHPKEMLESSVSPETYAEFLRTGFFYQAGAGTDGLPDFYQDSFHTEGYIRDQWKEHFTVEAFIRRGINFYQDLILCKKEPDPNTVR